MGNRFGTKRDISLAPPRGPAVVTVASAVIFFTNVRGDEGLAALLTTGNSISVTLCRLRAVNLRRLRSSGASEMDTQRERRTDGNNGNNGSNGSRRSRLDLEPEL